MGDQKEHTDVKSAAYRSIHGDGIWDISAGILLVAASVLMLTDNAAFIGVIPAIGIVTVPGLRKSLSARMTADERVLDAKNEIMRKISTWLLLLMSLSALSGAFVFFVYSGNSEWQRLLQKLGALPFGMALATVSGVLGLLVKAKRLLVYSAVIPVIFLLGLLLGIELPIQLAVVGVILATTGCVLLISFIASRDC